MKREQIAKNIIADLKELAALTSDANGAQRVAWSPVYQQAAQWFQRKMQAAGAETWIDAAGNSWAKFTGLSEEAIVIGSHLDSVPNGGWLDGALGVVAGMGIGAACAGKKLAKTLYVVGWIDEEGVAFGTSCLGSSIVSGKLTVNDVLPLKERDGRSFSKVMHSLGLNADQIGKAHEAFSKLPVKAYLELHIEQAPLLALAKKSVACVYGVCGCHRQYITFHGQQGHCGSPVALRQDAFLAAAAATLDFKEIALKYDSYCTVGHVEVGPDVITISPGYCRISLDQRCIKPELLQTMVEEAQAAARKRAEENKVTVDFAPIWHAEPVLFDAELVKACTAAVEAETGEKSSMYSGPLHDAVPMNAVVPSVMMFAQSDPGISHCKEENTPLPALEEAIRAFIRLAEIELATSLTE